MRNYNIIERFQQKNQKPTIQITEDFSVKVNNSMKVGIILRSFLNEDTELSEEILEKIYKLTIGEENAKKVMEMDLTFEATMLLIDAISSAISGEELQSEEDKTFSEEATTEK